MIVIGVTGKLGSGKDYITNNVIIPVLEKFKHRYLQSAFADQIKVNVMTKNHISYEDVYENKTQESRRLLQFEGTEVGRSYNRNIWVNYMDNWMKVHSNRGIDVFIISDVRFKNEYDFIKRDGQFGLIIRVVAPKRNESRLLKESDGNKEVYDAISKHASECDLDDVNDDCYDLVIKNDVSDILNIEELQDTIEKKLSSFV